MPGSTSSAAAAAAASREASLTGGSFARPAEAKRAGCPGGAPPELSTEFGISTAAGGQLRTVSGLSGAVAALVTIAVRRRMRVRRLLTWGLSALAAGALASAAAPSFAALAAAQLPIGAGLALVPAGGIAAAAEWTTPEDSRASSRGRCSVSPAPGSPARR